MLVTLARQPLFRLIAAIVVLLITDYRPVWGSIAALLWFLWILLPHYYSTYQVGGNGQEGKNSNSRFSQS